MLVEVELAIKEQALVRLQEVGTRHSDIMLQFLKTL